MRIGTLDWNQPKWRESRREEPQWGRNLKTLVSLLLVDSIRKSDFKEAKKC